MPRTGSHLIRLLVLVALLSACSGGGESPVDGDTSAAATPSGGPDGGLEGLEAVFDSLGGLEEGSFGLDRWSLVGTGIGEPSGQALRVSFPEGSVSPSASREHGAPGGGMQVFLDVDGEPLDAGYLRYWVRLPEDFAFAKGGKLPGLFGGSEVSGGEEPDGTDGFSTRLMWREDGAGEVYLYAPGESGTSLGRGSWTWPRGDWVCVEQHVALNDPDRDDGSVTVWLDGEEVFTEDGLRYRAVEDLKIDGVFFSTFFGGADPSWASPKDQYADFAAFALSADRLGCA
ncbi:polysaccharide lyase [Modestobacter lapidis]|nr:hypothetical protein [Modestobacter lapidis]